MPKAAKAISYPNRRTAPYSVITATPKAQSPTMADRGPVPSHAKSGRSNNDNHGNSWRSEDDTILMRARQLRMLAVRGMNVSSTNLTPPVIGTKGRWMTLPAFISNSGHTYGRSWPIVWGKLGKMLRPK